MGNYSLCQKTQWVVRLHRDYFEFDFIHVELDRKLKHTEDVRQTTGYTIPDLDTDLNRRHKLVSHLSVGAN